MSTSLLDWMRRRPLISFFVLAYAICAAAFLSDFIFPVEAFSPVWLIGAFSPTIAGIIMAGVIGGWPEIRRLLSGYARWRIGWQWYLAALSMALAPLLVALVYIALGNEPRGPAPDLTLWIYVGWLFKGWLSGPLAEETGWRGFALPRLQSRMSALNASLLLGVLWAFWHLPQYLTGGVASGGMIPLPIFVPLTVALAILFTWVFNNTRGSLVATTLMHYSYNFAGGHLAGLLGLMPPMLLYGAGVGILVFAAIVVVVAGPKYLSRHPASEMPIQPAAAPDLPQAVREQRPSAARP